MPFWCWIRRKRTRYYPIGSATIPVPLSAECVNYHRTQIQKHSMKCFKMIMFHLGFELVGFCVIISCVSQSWWPVSEWVDARCGPGFHCRIQVQKAFLRTRDEREMADEHDSHVVCTYLYVCSGSCLESPFFVCATCWGRFDAVRYMCFALWFFFSSFVLLYVHILFSN